MMGTNNFTAYEPGRVYLNNEAASAQPLDVVNKPSHYMLKLNSGIGVEVYDIRTALLHICDEEGVPAGQVDDWSRSWEYLTRMWGKNGLEDAKKARWYLDKLIGRMEHDT